jgi:putative acetyltransferase
MRQKIVIRAAAESDAAAIVKVHYEAVHLIASNDYEQDILNEWSSDSVDRSTRLKTQISQNVDQTIMIVAEVDGTVVGFGEVVPDKGELRAVYVSPTAARMGIGSALLHKLENESRHHKVQKLWLDSSLTAVPFYLAHGYQSDGEGAHQLGSGRLMTCVKMHKILSTT